MTRFLLLACLLPLLARAHVGSPDVFFEGHAGPLAGAAARDSTRAPGAVPTPRDRTRGRFVAGLAVLLLSGSIYAVTLRWRGMDREFRDHALARPLPVSASVRTEGGLRLLHLSP